MRSAGSPVPHKGAGPWALPKLSVALASPRSQSQPMVPLFPSTAHVLAHGASLTWVTAYLGISPPVLSSNAPNKVSSHNGPRTWSCHCRGMAAHPLAPGCRPETGSQESGGSHGVVGLLRTIQAAVRRTGRACGMADLSPGI